MIRDLRLNARHHLKKRQKVLVMLTLVVGPEPPMPEKRQKTAFDYLASRSTELSSIARTWLYERGYEFTE